MSYSTRKYFYYTLLSISLSSNFILHEVLGSESEAEVAGDGPTVVRRGAGRVTQGGNAIKLRLEHQLFPVF
jgi:hypothetical protein